MACKLRLEFPGACYHVINRGNYRSDIFKTAGAKATFQACLFETGAKSGWLLHSFVISHLVSITKRSALQPAELSALRALSDLTP